MSPQATFIVARFVPRDIHRYSHASAAAVLLAAALNWDVIEKPNRPTILRTGDRKDGVVIEIPDQTNLRFGVFRSWMHKIATHSPEFILPMDVAVKIADTAKLSPDHRRVITDLAEQSVIPDSTPDEPIDGPEATLISREPYMAHLGNATTYQSAASFERIWSDGHRDYECMVCGESFPGPKSLGGHRQKHINAGEAEPIWRDSVRTAVRGKDPDWERIGATPTINGVAPPEPEPEEPEAELPEPEEQPELPLGLEPTPLIDPELQPSDLLTQHFEGLRLYVQEVLLENASLKAQLRKLRSDMAAMFSLMQDLQQPE